MDPTEEAQIRRAVDRCKADAFDDAPFEKLQALLNAISQRYDDRFLNAEFRRLRITIKHLMAVQRPKARLQYLKQLVEFAERLPGTIRAARIRMERTNARSASASTG